MTIPSTARKAGPLLGTGAQTAWPFTFKVFATSDIAVTIANSLGVETALVLNTDYSVALNANQETSPGGTVTYPISGTALAVGSVLSIVGDIDYDQPLDLPSGGNFSPLALENQLDRATMQIQQLKEELGRTLQVNVTTGADTEMPAPEAGAIIGWNAGATGLENIDPASLATALAFATFRFDTFTGDGVTTQFALTTDPATLGNLDVAIDGLTQVPSVDYTLAAGFAVFTLAPTGGAEILVRYGEALPSGVTDAQDVRITDAGGYYTGTDVEAALQEAALFTQPGTGAVTRTQTAKLRESISVKDFGAVGDGVTNDTVAVQAAITAAANGSLYLSPGTYLCGELTGSDGLHLYGSTAGVSTIKATGTMSNGLLNFLSKNNLLIENLTLDYNTTTTVGTTSLLGFLDCDNVLVRNCRLLNFVKLGIGINSCNYVWIENNYIEKTTPDSAGVNECILLTESGFGTSSNLVVSNNRCNNSGLLLQGSYLTVKNNIVTNWRYGAGVGIGQTASTFNVTIDGNTFFSGYAGLDSDGFTCKGIELWGSFNIVTNNTCRGNSGPGIYVGSPRSIITNNRCVDNGTYTAEVGGGIVLGYTDATWNASNSVVANNTCYDSLGAGGTQDYGITIAASVTGLMLAGNHLTTNRVGPLLNSSGQQTFYSQKYEGSVSFDMPSINAGSNASTGITVGGASLGDMVTVSASVDLQGLVLSGYVNTTNSVIVVLSNPTAAAVNLGVATYRAAVSKTVL